MISSRSNRTKPAVLAVVLCISRLATPGFAFDGVEAQTAPPLPSIDLASYSPSARGAIAPLQRAAASRPSDPKAVGDLARMLQAWDQLDAAHQAYARAQDLAPHSFEWLYLDGVVLERLARHTEAAERFDRALNESPDYLPARLALPEALIEAGDLSRSRRLFESLRREPLAEPRAEFGLGRIDAAENHQDAAIRHFERALALFPEWGAANYALAQSYRAVGRQDDARAALQRHAKYGARWPGADDPVLAAVSALKDDAATHLQRGISLAAAGNLPGAIAEHEAALARDPKLAQAHANLISLYGRVGNWDKVDEHYRATVALGFSLGDAHYDYGVLLGQQQKWDQAEEAYRKAIAVNPLHVAAHNNLGQLLERRQLFDAAATEYARALDAQPSFRLARFNLGRMQITLGRLDEAIATLDKLREPVDEATPRYLFALSTAHVRAGHKDEGVKWATAARELALQYGQRELADAIERDLARLK
jgi:tetratricopeptide (TPR) repeat protein